MFQRTQNDDGTHASRCLYCFLTLTSNCTSESELEKLEKAHLCPERALQEMRLMKEAMPPEQMPN